MKISLEPVGFVSNDRTDTDVREWGAVESCITLCAPYDENTIEGIELFSHLEILFHFHLLDKELIVTGARHPNNDTNLPKVGIFSQRGRMRPNRLGATIVELIKIEGNSLIVRGLDALDGTPVVDIKPTISQFLPRGDIRQPSWVDTVMEGFW